VKLHSRLPSCLAVTLALVVASLSGFTPAQGATDTPAARRVNWNRFHFNNASTGYNPFETVITPATVGTLTEQYRYATGFSIIHGGPSVTKGFIYENGTDEHLFGRLFVYRDRCGQPTCRYLWKSTPVVGDIATPTVAGQFVFVVSSNPPGKIFSFPAAGCGQSECDPLWSGTLANGTFGVYAAVAGGLVFAAGGGLEAWNAAGCGQQVCEPLWIGEMNFDPTLEGGVTVANGVAYVMGVSGRLYAFDAHGCGQSTCEPLWTWLLGQGYGNDGSQYSVPAVVNGIVYVGAHVEGFGILAAFDAAGCGQPTCEPLWEGKGGFASAFDSSPAIANGVVYIASFQDYKLYAFDAAGCGQATCAPLWTGRTVDFATASPITAGGVVYVPDNTGHVNAFDAAGCGQRSCAPIWVGEVSPGHEIAATPALVNGRLYVASLDSFVHVLAPTP
jgi:outer membrane protein assembly factor BamB